MHSRVGLENSRGRRKRCSESTAPSERTWDEGARAAAETEEDAPPGADGGVPHIPGAYLIEEDAAGQPRYIIQPSPDDVVVDVEAR